MDAPGGPPMGMPQGPPGPMPMPGMPVMGGQMPGGPFGGMMPPPNMGMPPGAPGMIPGPMGLPGVTFKKPRPPQPLDKWADVPQNNTLYVNNLNEKVGRRDIVNGLREVFGQFGDILEIICYTKIRKCKGQAWIVFDSIESAKAAREELQEFMFYNKPLHVHFAKDQSDATRRRDGQPIPVRQRPPKRTRAAIRKQKEEAKLKAERERAAKEDESSDEEDKDELMKNAPESGIVKGDEKQQIGDEFGNLRIKEDEPRAVKPKEEEPFTPTGPISFNMKRVGEDDDEYHRAKKRIVDNDGQPVARPVSREMDEDQKQAPIPKIQRNLPPNHTLFLEGMPPDCSQQEIDAIFSQCAGFQGVTLFPAKPGIGFCRFGDVVHSTTAMRSLVGLTIRGHTVRLSYAAQ